MRLKYDFHIHSCLSPCGDDDMTPHSIAGMAALAGQNIVALSDHNSTRNCAAFISAAQKMGLLALPALELNTREEVHVLCLLPSIEAADEFGCYVYSKLPEIPNRPEIFGNQYVMDEEDHIIDEEKRLLIAATSIGIYDVSGLLEAFNGIAIPAHVDRNSFSILYNLGFISPEMGFNTLEITRSADRKELANMHPELKGKFIICDSDAHRLVDMPDAQYSVEVAKLSAAGVISALREGTGLFKL